METTNQHGQNLTEPGSTQGVELQEGSLIRCSRVARKLSGQFGWPMLLFLAIGPPSNFGAGEDSSFPLYLWIGSLPVIGAVVLRVWARGYIRVEGFVMDGPYRYVRNPVELGTVIAYVGASIIMGLPVVYTLVVAAIAVSYISLASFAFERDLLMRIGGVYLRYCKRVRKWIPSSLPGTNRTARTYSLLHGLKHERESLLWLLGYLVVFAVRQRLIHS